MPGLKAAAGEQGAGDLAEQAAAWFLRLRAPDCSEEDRRAFDAWLAASERHDEEFRLFERLWGRLDGLGKPRQRPARLLAAGRRAAALAALAVGLGLAAGIWRPAAMERTIATGPGERRQLALDDGTRVDLNAATRLRVAFDGRRRQVTVERGEALFAVAPDAERPFEVRAGAGTLRDIGTAFDVAVEDQRVSVGVVEGAVEVRLADRDQVAVLTGGQRLDYSAAGLARPGPYDAEAATAWRSGRFLFRETPLDDVLRQLNRQHPRPTLLADADLARLRVSGAFYLADRDGLLKALETLYPIRRQEEADSTRLAWRNRR